MKNIVITGSTRGIGFGLAQEFLKAGCNVVVAGRTSESVNRALAALGSSFSQQVKGLACDVSDPAQIEALWVFAKDAFGHVDIWINNAGIAHPQIPFTDHTPEEIRQGIDINLTSMMIGSQIALKGFAKQGRGAIYNMQGLGSSGRIVPGLTLYGTSKAAHPYFHKALTKEAEEYGIITGVISPGMVLTDMITTQYENNPEGLQKNKKIFNLIANRVEDITPVIIRQIIRNTKTGVEIKAEPGYAVLLRFLTAPFSKRNIFDSDK